MIEAVSPESAHYEQVVALGNAKRNPHRAGIRLSCRKDYEAHAMWPQLGFRPIGERTGRGRDRLPLVTWWRPVAARSRHTWCPSMVPIKPEFARVILGYEEPQGRLIEMNRGAAAARDNVYYRSPRAFECPARLIWWVSGGGPLSGVRAMSWLDEAETGHPRRLHRKYHNYGVLDEQQVLNAASSPRKRGQPKATALVFSQTEVFRAPVPIGRSRELCDSMNTPGFFQTAQRIDEDVVCRFYEEGMRSNDG